jgi:hypothetical protein
MLIFVDRICSVLKPEPKSAQAIDSEIILYISVICVSGV